MFKHLTKQVGKDNYINKPVDDKAKKPGITTKVDLKSMDIDNSNPNEPTIKPKSPKPQGQGSKIRPGQTVSISTEEKKKD